MGAHADLETILSYWEDFGPRERRALAVIARRMYWGQCEYGKLKYRKKNWQEEAFQEAADMAVYLAASLVDMEDDSGTGV